MYIPHISAPPCDCGPFFLPILVVLLCPMLPTCCVYGTATYRMTIIGERCSRVPLPFRPSFSASDDLLWLKGTRSSMELASLGPATVLCESLIYCSTFLAIATTNLQATALADGKRAEAQKVCDTVERAFCVSWRSSKHDRSPRAVPR